MIQPGDKFNAIVIESGKRPHPAQGGPFVCLNIRSNIVNAAGCAEPHTKRTFKVADFRFVKE